ncbi:MAG: hypothetical protein NTV62_04370, partial [Candidatus Gribaldobacteria bacterium]|nr:hypothetical protein [Candidatus Gribaldobacteria bacterium]
GVKTAYLQVSDGVQTAQSARCSVTATANTPTPVPVEDKSRGTLSASSLSVFMGEYVSVSINGLDANGIDRICLQKQTSGYDYDCKSCSRATSCSGTWYVTSPYFGTFDWYGSVIGLTTMGNDDTAATNPVKVSIEFKNKCVSDSGCDYNGKRECLVGQNNGYRICETDPNGCRKWRSDSCNNQICQASDGQCVNPVVANCNSNNCVSEYSSDYKCNDLKTRLDRVWLSRQCVNDVCQTNPISLYSNFSITCSGADKVEYRCSWNNLEKRITKTNSICLTDQNKCGDQVGNWELVKTCGSGTCDFVKQDCISAPITPPVTPQCIANDHKSCDNGDVYWFDSCNVRGALVKDCGSNVVEDYICSLDNKLQKRTLSDTCSGKVCDQLISGYLTVLDCNVGNLNCDVTQKKCVNFCTAHNYQKCDNNSIYYYNACGVREEAVKNCSDLDSVTSELRCNPSGTNWVQVKKIKGVCSGNDTVCSTNTEWSDYKQCDSQQTCNSGQCVGKIDVCKAKSYTACYSGSLFWFSSCDRAEVFYQDCQDEATNEYRCSADYKVLERKYLTKTCGVGK